MQHQIRPARVATATALSAASSVTGHPAPTRFSSTLAEHASRSCGSSSTTITCFMPPPARSRRPGPASRAGDARCRCHARPASCGASAWISPAWRARPAPGRARAAASPRRPWLGEVGHHDHRQIRAAPGQRHLAQHVVAAHLGHHQVEQQQVEPARLGAQDVQALLAVVRRPPCGSGLRGSTLRTYAAHRRIVVRHEHAEWPAWSRRATTASILATRSCASTGFMQVFRSPRERGGSSARATSSSNPVTNIIGIVPGVGSASSARPDPSRCGASAPSRHVSA